VPDPGADEASAMPDSDTTSLAQRLDAAVAGLPPAYFGLVMATGIVAIACQLFGLLLLSKLLYGISAACYVTLWVLTLARIIRYPRKIFADFGDHGLAPGFFTMVAATGVMGTQFASIDDKLYLAGVFWWLAVLLALGLTYPIFTLLITKREKPPIDRAINGGWLLLVVAWQSVSVLGGTLAPLFQAYTQELLFVSLMTWLVGGILYLWIISLIFYRYLFFPFKPQDLAPPYWINMGAMAISTLAGVGLVRYATSSPLLVDLVPFLKGGTLVFWATATWWIPMLLLLGYWRHVYRRFPVRYSPLYWGAVFPLGMYTVATYRLAGITEVTVFYHLSSTFIWVALAAWGLAFVGLLKNVGKVFLG